MCIDNKYMRACIIIVNFCVYDAIYCWKTSISQATRQFQAESTKLRKTRSVRYLLILRWRNGHIVEAPIDTSAKVFFLVIFCRRMNGPGLAEQSPDEGPVSYCFDIGRRADAMCAAFQTLFHEQISSEVLVYRKVRLVACCYILHTCWCCRQERRSFVLWPIPQFQDQEWVLSIYFFSH